MRFYNWAYRTLRIHRLNAKGNMPLTHVFDMIRRPDCSNVLLIETWGGFNKGYAKEFASENILLTYLSKRLNKIVRPANEHINLGKLTGGQTKITMDEGHFTVVHDKKDMGESYETFRDDLMTTKLDIDKVVAFAHAIGYIDTGWHNGNNIAKVLKDARDVEENAIMHEVACAMLARIGLNADESDIVSLCDSVVEIRDFMQAPNVTSVEHEMFPGNFDKAIFKAANMLRGWKSLKDEPDAPAAPTESVLTDEEEEIMHSKQYTSWGAWS
jgi:hypothetical protein